MNIANYPLPPGFRFHPTDQELIIHYLKKKVSSSQTPIVSIIADIDLYKYNPWELPGASLFFFFFFYLILLLLDINCFLILMNLPLLLLLMLMNNINCFLMYLHINTITIHMYKHIFACIHITASMVISGAQSTPPFMFMSRCYVIAIFKLLVCFKVIASNVSYYVSLQVRPCLERESGSSLAQERENTQMEQGQIELLLRVIGKPLGLINPSSPHPGHSVLE